MSAALALALILGLVLPAESSRADDRVLRVQDGTAVRQYPVTELIEAIGLTELRVGRDPHFGPDRVFAGFALEPLLDHVGLGDAAELLLVCADGYSIAFAASVRSQPGLRGLLAVRDAALPADAGSHWEAFQHGTETVSFDPFYLVWASSDESFDVGSDALPWPFQLTEIRRFDRERYFAPARPPAAAADAVQAGFPLYADHCGKCHRLRGVGGGVGPPLDREGGLAAVLPTEQLRDYVRHDEHSFPRSKMPQFSKLLRPEQIDEVVAYLQAMQLSRRRER